MDWNEIPGNETIERTAEAIRGRGTEVTIVEEKAHALEKIVSLIPEGAEIMNGSSTTLIEIGFVDYLKNHSDKYRNMHEVILCEGDRQKQADLRRKSVTSEYFLGSVNAIAETGELFACDASGSRVGAYPYAAKHLILVSGVNKIVPTWDDGIERLRRFVFPLEDKRARAAYGAPSSISKMVIIEKESIPDRINLILVKEVLGY